MYGDLGAKHLYSSAMGNISHALWKLDYKKLATLTTQTMKPFDYFIEIKYTAYKYAGVCIRNIMYSDLMYMWIESPLTIPILGDILYKAYNKSIGFPIPNCSMHEELKKANGIDIRSLTIGFVPRVASEREVSGTLNFKFDGNYAMDKAIDFSCSSGILSNMFNRWNTIKCTSSMLKMYQNGIKPLIKKDILLAIACMCSGDIVFSEKGFNCHNLKIGFNFDTNSWVFDNKQYHCDCTEFINKIMELGASGSISCSKIFS